MKLGVFWKYPTLAKKVPLPTFPFRTKSQVAVPSAPVRSPAPVGSLQVPLGKFFGSEPPPIWTLTLGIGSPVTEVTRTTTAPSKVAPAAPERRSPGFGVSNLTCAGEPSGV